MPILIIAAGVGMGGGTSGATTGGPYCVMQAQTFVPGAEPDRQDVFRAGAIKRTELLKPGAEPNTQEVC